MHYTFLEQVSAVTKMRVVNKPIRSQCTRSLLPENLTKPYGFLMFSGRRERVHWERMGY